VRRSSCRGDQGRRHQSQPSQRAGPCRSLPIARATTRTRRRHQPASTLVRPWSSMALWTRVVGTTKGPGCGFDLRVCSGCLHGGMCIVQCVRHGMWKWRRSNALSTGGGDGRDAGRRNAPGLRLDLNPSEPCLRIALAPVRASVEGPRSRHLRCGVDVDGPHRHPVVPSATRQSPDIHQPAPRSGAVQPCAVSESHESSLKLNENSECQMKGRAPYLACTLPPV